MTVAASIAVAAIFIWLGMVAAISFLEAPLKFRAPGVTLAIGLGIGRRVFRALNTVEAILAVVVVVALIVDTPPCGAVVGAALAVLALLGQLLAVRPRLTRRSDAVLADTTGVVASTRSRAHYGYLVLEVVKVGGLFLGGVVLLATVR
jgi:hypothetical protein